MIGLFIYFQSDQIHLVGEITLEHNGTVKSSNQISQQPLPLHWDPVEWEKQKDTGRKADKSQAEFEPHNQAVIERESQSWSRGPVP